MSSWNLAAMSEEEQKRVQMDKVAAAVVWKERMGKPVSAEMEARQFPAELRPLFDLRLAHFRQVSASLPRGHDPVYQKHDEKPDAAE